MTHESCTYVLTYHSVLETKEDNILYDVKKKFRENQSQIRHIIMAIVIFGTLCLRRPKKEEKQR